MLTKYDHFRAGERAENIVRKPAKRFPKLEARNIKVELLCESYDTMFDAGAFFPKAYEIKSLLEKRGFKRAFFYVNGRKSQTPALNFTVSYWDVDPRDPFTGTPYFELMRTED